MSDKFRSSLVNKIEEKRAFEEKQNNLKECKFRPTGVNISFETV